MIVTTTIQSISTTATNATMKVTTQFYGVQSQNVSGGSVESVNNELPDGNGNVALTAAEIPETLNRFWLTTILKSAYDNAVTALNALLLTGQRLITSAEITKLLNTSGTNTGDVTVSDTDTVDLTITGQALSADVKKQMSIISDASGVKLDGDAASPGNSKYYGTDGAGAKGFHNLPTGGGGGKKTMTASVTNSTNVYAAITELNIPIAANEIIAFHYNIGLSASPAGGVRFSIILPTGATGPGGGTTIAQLFANTLNNPANYTTGTIIMDGSDSPLSGGASTALQYQIWGVVKNGANAGNITIRFRSDVNTQTTTISPERTFVRYD
jgi:hypothetical protein